MQRKKKSNLRYGILINRYVIAKFLFFLFFVTALYKKKQKKEEMFTTLSMVTIEYWF